MTDFFNTYVLGPLGLGLQKDPVARAYWEQRFNYGQNELRKVQKAGDTAGVQRWERIIKEQKEMNDDQRGVSLHEAFWCVIRGARTRDQLNKAEELYYKGANPDYTGN